MTEIITLISGLIGVFVFITGVQSLPALFGATQSPEATVSVATGRYFWPLVVLTQVGYFVCLYVVVHSLYKCLWFPCSLPFFWGFVIFALSFTGSMFFAEGFWGPISEFTANNIGPTFLAISAIAELFTIACAVDSSWL